MTAPKTLTEEMHWSIKGIILFGLVGQGGGLLMRYLSKKIKAACTFAKAGRQGNHSQSLGVMKKGSWVLSESRRKEENLSSG